MTETATVNKFNKFVQRRTPAQAVANELLADTKPVAPDVTGMTRWEAAAVKIVWTINTGGPALLRNKYYAKIAQYNANKAPQLKIRHRRMFLHKPYYLAVTAENQAMLDKIAEALNDEKTTMFSVRAGLVGRSFIRTLINETFRASITDEDGKPKPTGVHKFFVYAVAGGSFLLSFASLIIV